MDLIDELFVVGDDILGSNILGLVGLEQLQAVADVDEIIEDGLFCWIYRCFVEWRV